jgi:uncharacterized Tic20 family protein
MNQPPTASESPPPPPPPPPPGPTSGTPTSDERTLALLAHLLGIFTWIIGALIIWLIKKDSSAYVNDQGKEALNFQITVTIIYFLGGATTCLGVGFLILAAVWVINIVFCILAAVAANRGERYRYPIAIRLIS